MATDIIIYTTQRVLKHKIKLIDCHWDLPTKPRKKITPDESLVYFATEGFIRGSFEITNLEEKTMYFDYWEPLVNLIHQKPFQGFKYLKK